MITIITIPLVLILLFIVVVLLRVKVPYKSTKEYPCPYYLSVINQSMEGQEVVLFGLNRYLLSVNFGSEVGVWVNSHPHVKYLELLQQSGSQPFETRIVRLVGTISDLSAMVITITTCDLNGQACSIPVFVKSYMPKEYTDEQLRCKQTIDIPYPIKIDGSTSLSYSQPPNSMIEWNIYYNTSEYMLVRLYKCLKSYLWATNPKYKVLYNINSMPTLCSTPQTDLQNN